MEQKIITSIPVNEHVFSFFTVSGKIQFSVLEYLNYLYFVLLKCTDTPLAK